jgi:nucleoside-diphosphate-sugar epimerase
MQLLVTGATGKVGVNLIERLLSDLRWRVARVRALCHSRSIAETDRIEVVKGSIEERDCFDRLIPTADNAGHGEKRDYFLTSPASRVSSFQAHLR